MTIDKLGGSSTPPVRGGPPASRAQPGPEASAGPRSAGAPAADAVSLTPQSQQLREVESKLAETPAFDAARVAELRKAIERGDYRVDSRRLAGKLLDFERELSAPPGGE